MKVLKVLLGLDNANLLHFFSVELGDVQFAWFYQIFHHFYFSFDTTIAHLRATPKAAPMEIILPLSYKMIDDLHIKCVGSRKEDIYC